MSCLLQCQVYKWVSASSGSAAPGLCQSLDLDPGIELRMFPLCKSCCRNTVYEVCALKVHPAASDVPFAASEIFFLGSLLAPKWGLSVAFVAVARWFWGCNTIYLLLCENWNLHPLLFFFFFFPSPTPVGLRLLQRGKYLNEPPNNGNAPLNRLTFS